MIAISTFPPRSAPATAPVQGLSTQLRCPASCRARTPPSWTTPSKPPKPFRDILAKRRKKQQDAIDKLLTPTLTRAFADYCSSGQRMPTETVTLRRAELGAVLSRALDGDYDGQVDCAYCAAVRKAAERQHAAGDDASMLQVRPP